MRSFIALTVALTAVVVASPAAATCEAPSCGPIKFPAEGRAIPAGITALPVFVDGPVLIRQNNEDVFGGAPRNGLLQLGAALAPGSYLLFEHRAGCPGSLGREFRVMPRPSLPPSVGALAAQRSDYRQSRIEYEQCERTPSAERVVVPVTLQPSAEMEPWLPVTYLVVMVDGQRTTRSGWGDTDGASITGETQTYEPGKPITVISLATACDGTTNQIPGNEMAVSEGVHHVELRARIADVTADLPIASTDVEVRCYQPPPASDVESDFDMTQRSGCAAAPRSTPLVGAFALLAMIGFAVRRRRG